jgi:hypothetical protein
MVRNMFSESIAASLVFFGSAFFFRKDDPRNVEILALEKDLKDPVLVDRRVFDPSGLHVYRLLGQVTLVFGAVLTGCAVIPGSAVAPSSINWIAGLMLAVFGGVLIYAARERKEIAS